MVAPFDSVRELAPLRASSALDPNGRLPGCGEPCGPVFIGHARGRWWHDPRAHEAYGALLAGSDLRQVVLVVTGRLTVDLTRLEVSIDGRVVSVTPQEFRFLRVLAARVGATVDYAEILAALLAGDDIDGLVGKWNRHMIRVHLARLRARLGDEGQLIRTVMGLGYRLERLPPGTVLPVVARRPRSTVMHYAWSHDYPACTACRSTRLRHRALGLCETCYSRERRRRRRGD